jgi:hypothetical protein
MSRWTVVTSTGWPAFPRPGRDLRRGAKADSRVRVVNQLFEFVDRPSEESGQPLGGQAMRLLAHLALRLSGLRRASPSFVSGQLVSRHLLGLAAGS